MHIRSTWTRARAVGRPALVPALPSAHVAAASAGPLALRARRSRHASAHVAASSSRTPIAASVARPTGHPTGHQKTPEKAPAGPAFRSIASEAARTRSKAFYSVGDLEDGPPRTASEACRAGRLRGR